MAVFEALADYVRAAADRLKGLRAPPFETPQPQKIGSPPSAIQSSNVWTFLVGRLRSY
jgi:hypothetical protein